MPNIEETLQEIANFKYYTTLDLNSGYYQVPIAPESQKYTAFITTEGLYNFKCMPFGLKNAPAVFQRLMAKIKDRVKPTGMIHYMDDILVGSHTIDEMCGKIKRVFQAMRELNLTLNIKNANSSKLKLNFGTWSWLWWYSTRVTKNDCG